MLATATSSRLGAELNDLNVFNLFAINATGSLFFEDFDDFEEGLVAAGTAVVSTARPIFTRPTQMGTSYALMSAASHCDQYRWRH